MNRNQIYRKTIAYCMVWMMVLQLFTGWGVKEVSAEGGTPAITFNVNDAKIYSAEDCDNEDAWAIPYEIVGLAEGNTVYLSVESTLDGGSGSPLISEKKLEGISNLTWGVGASGSGSDQVAVKFAETGVAKGTVYLKKPDAQAEYTITISVKNTSDAVIVSEGVTVTYIPNIEDPTVTLTDLNSSLDPSVVEAAADGSVSGTWTKQDVTFNIKVQDAVVGLKSITYELDGVSQTDKNKSYSAGSYEKSEVQQSFTVSTSASSATGHKLVVTAVNARDKVTTFTRYILVDQDTPGIALTIKETGSAVEDNKVYGNPVTMAAAVTESLSATGMVVTYKVKKDGGSEVASTVTASSSGTYEKEFTEDGIYEVSVVAVDGAGNSFETTPVTFTVDGTKPVITQTSAQENGKYYNADQTFQYKVTDANLAGGKVSGKIERVLNGTTADTAIDKNCSDSEVQDSHTCDEEGAYQITVNARDAAGNRAAAAHEVGFVVDKKAPVLGILAKDTEDQTIATGGKTKKNVKVTYQVTDRNHQFSEYKITVKRTSAAGVEVSNDTQTVASANWKLSSTDTSKQNNITANTTVEYSEEGSYEITFSGKDAAGNEGTQKTISFVIDKTEPVISGVSYTTNQVAITPKYGIIFGNQIIQVNFTVEDAFTGLKTDKPVLVTIGTAADRNGTTTSYPAQHVSGGSYYVQLPLESVTSFDNKITIWAYDQVENEQSFESERTIYNTNSSTIAMTCTTRNEGVWTNQNVIYDTKVTDTLCGIRSITYNKIETVNGSQITTQVHEVQFSDDTASEMTTEYEYNFTATDTALTADGYKLQVKVVNNCGTTTTMEKTVYVDKVAPVVELSGVDNEGLYKTEKTICTTVTDVSYRNTSGVSGTTTHYYVTCKRDGQDVPISWEDFVSTQYTDTAYKTLSEEGNYKVYAVTTDSAGNRSTSDTLQFAIDHTAPVIDNVTYTAGGELIGPKYGIYFNKQAIRVSFSVKDTIVGLKDSGAVLVTVGKKTDRNNGTTLYPATSLQGDTYCVTLPLEDVNYFDNTITIWAYDKLSNEAAAESVRTIYNTNASDISMVCTTNNDGVWTNGDVTYHTVVTDTKCGISKITYTKIETVNGVEQREVVKEVDFEQQRQQGLLRDFRQTYTYDFTATETAQTVDGYVLRVDVTNNCDVSTFMEKKVYIDKVAPEVTLSGTENGAHYNTDQTVHTVVKDLSYRNTKTQYYVTCQYDGQNITIPWEDFLSGNYTDEADKELSVEGNYEIYAVTKDSAGNTKESNHLQFTIDKQAPVIESVKVVKGLLKTEQNMDADGNYYVDDDAQLDVVATDHFPTVDASVWIEGTHSSANVPEESHAMTTSPFTFTSNTYSVEGRYALTVGGKDKAGNSAVTVSKAVVVDKTAPELSIHGILDGQMTKDSVTLTYQAVDKNHDFDQYRVTVKRTTLDGVNETTVEQNAAKWRQTGYNRDEQVDYTTTRQSVYSEEGNYEITFEGTDKAGNVAVTKSISFSIDHTAPVIGDVTYTAGGALIGPKYGIIFNKQAIRVSFSVKDTIVGLKDSGAVLVTVGKKTDRNDGTTLYPATSLQGDTYCVTLPLEDVNYFDNTITIWAYDKLSNEGVLESVRTIFNTNASDISMECTTDNDGVWTNEDVTYHTVVTDTKCGISKITYTKIETVDGVEQREVVKEIDFEQQRQQGLLTDFKQTYTYDFTATETAQTVDGYVLRVDVTNNCDVSTFMEKKVYIDKVAPEVTLSGTENGAYYNTDQTVHTVVKDLSYPDTKTQYYVTCQYDGRSVDVTWDDFRSTDYTDETDKVVSAEGTYKIYAVTTDSAGNQTTSNTLRFTIDKEAPVIVEARVIKGIHETEQPVNGDGVYYVNADGKLAVKVTDHFPSPDGHVYVEGKLKDTVMQQEEYVMDSSPFSFVTQTPYTEEGKYAVTVSGKDKANNTAVNVYRDIVVDKTSPQLTISGIGQGQMTREPVTLTYQSVDKNHDFEQYRVTVRRTRLDGVDETLVEQNATDWKQTGYDRDSQENYTTTRTSVYKEEGSYEVTFEGTDKAGNVATVKTIAFSIDHTAPVISDISYSDPSGLLTPKYQIIFSNQVIQVKFRVEDRVVGIEDSLVYVTLGTARERLEGAPMYIANKSGDGYYYVNIPSDLAVKEYDGVLSIWANDRLKNESVAETVRMIQNEDKPAIIMDCELDYTKWQSRNVTFHTKVSDPKSGLKEVTYTIDGKEVKKVTFTEFVKEYSYDLTATKTADKVTGYSMTIEVTNNNGTSSFARRQVYIDKKAPSVKLSGIKNGTHYNQNQKITTTAGDVSFKNTKTQYYVERTLDGKTYSEKISSFTLKKYEGKCIRTFHKEGRYKVYAVTTDSAGNRTKSNTLHFVVDKTAPKLAISGVQDGSMNGTDVEVQFSLTDSFYSTTDSLIRIEKTIDGTTTSEEKKDFPKTGKHSTWNRTFSEDGTYQITFTAKDKAGNVAKTQTISFSVDKTQPVIEITGTSNYQQWDKPVTVRFSVEESYYTGDQITIQGTRQDINGKKEELEFTTFANIAKVSSMTQLFEKDGIYDLVLKAKDEAGNEDQKEIHFVLDQTRPEVHKVGNYNGGYYQEFKIADTLEEVFKDLTVVSYRILLNGIEYDGTTPITEEGKYNLSVDVEDELGHKTSETAEFIIDHTAPKVIFTGVKDGQSVTESGVITLSLTNPEDEITGVSMNGTAYGADARQLEYAEYGRYHIEVDCVDKAGNKVTRTIKFTYHNPLTTTILFAIMGGLIVITCIWLWMRTMKKEKEEKRI